MYIPRHGSHSGSGRGRGYRGRFNRPSGKISWRKKPEVAEPPAPRLGSVLATVEISDLVEGLREEDSKITDCRDLASYNWLNRKEPTILIPGKPPAWTPQPDRVKLREDDGEYFRDQNAARYPSHPLQPAVEAILKQNPDFLTTDVDIVGCGSTLGNLLRFARGTDRKFRMVLEAIGSTVFFVRRENSPTQTISGVFGYGHTFPEANTTWEAEVKGSESHQRIIQYSFGGMKCLVRFEADGYHRDLVSQTSGPEDISADRSVDQLLSVLNGSTVSSHQPTEKNLTIESTGSYVPREAIFDLKTRTVWKKDKNIIGEELPRLWISQIPNLVLAFHRSGVFEDIEKIDAREHIASWEKQQKHDLSKFAALLRLLVAFARGQPERFEVFYDGESGVLELREACDDVNKTLPEEVDDIWLLGAYDGFDRAVVKEDAKEDADDWSDSDKDFTACSEECGYCGHC
ncbi:hypothetical protein ASPWEDRAFT_32389 [Aspergillus wentii DTO 134E9]|uniref:Geranylgeranyl pyrophosphate synthetase n=1 Tax=Aspergillus wentii DTO 134E9 TaxID=1073089 RepID=A0A1L9R5H3_ASPWE|nr:uncharacterized protein ASPWEDRAFT_32389 [Aspergillus wentii DTO 134E9]KAI9925316.1 hypothetical protein MW887_006244 [Aspergillus wentii]OJJ30186.1 hypothetical protein ASPWEDRAFT_32389 [Aspergillus wentii DTO 134E9]